MGRLLSKGSMLIMLLCACAIALTPRRFGFGGLRATTLFITEASRDEAPIQDLERELRRLERASRLAQLGRTRGGATVGAAARLGQLSQTQTAKSDGDRTDAIGDTSMAIVQQLPAYRPPQALSDKEFAELGEFTTSPVIEGDEAKRRYTRADLRATLNRTNGCVQLFRFENGTAWWDEDAKTHDDETLRYGDWSVRHRIPHLMKLFRDVARLAPQLHGGVLVSLLDTERTSCAALRNITQSPPPILTFSKCSDCALHVNIPDPQFCRHRGYTKLRKWIGAASRRHPWTAKKSDAVWRGALHGHLLDHECEPSGQWYKNRYPPWSKKFDYRKPTDAAHLLKCYPRMGLVEMARRLNSSMIDASLIGTWNHYDGSNALMKRLGLLGKFCDWDCELQSKLQLDIDGVSATWAGLFWKLASNSALLKIDSANGCSQWYHPRIQPGVHYFRAKTIEAVPDVVREALADDTGMRRVARAGTALIDSITWESEVQFTATLIKQILSLQYSEQEEKGAQFF